MTPDFREIVRKEFEEAQRKKTVYISENEAYKAKAHKTMSERPYYLKAGGKERWDT